MSQRIGYHLCNPYLGLKLVRMAYMNGYISGVGSNMEIDTEVCITDFSYIFYLNSIKIIWNKESMIFT